MKKLIFVLFISFAFVHTMYSQESTQTELEKLNKETVAFFQQGKYVNAIDSAKKVLIIEQESKDLNKIATAKLTLGIIQQRFYEALLKDQTISIDIRNINLQLTEGFPVKFIEVIDIYEKKLKIETTQLATANFELARFYQELGVPLNQTEKSYLNAISIREKLLGNNNDATLTAISYLADYYLKKAEFEKSSTLFETCIVRGEAANNQNKLATGLRGKVQLLNIAGEKEELEKTLKKLSNLSASLPKMEEIDLTPRAKSKNMHGGPKPYRLVGVVSNGGSSNDLINQPHISDVVQKTDPRTGAPAGYYDPRPQSRDPRAGYVNLPQSQLGSVVTIQSKITIYDNFNNMLDVIVKVSIDEQGKVLTATPNGIVDGGKIYNREKVKEKIIEKVMKMEFKPMIYDGKPRKLEGYIHYLYYL
jgi:hypothetical protein